MSHAAQLLAESPHLTSEDERLTEIIRSECRPRERHHQQRAAPLAARGDASRAAVAAGLDSRSSTRSSARRCSGRASGLRSAARRRISRCASIRASCARSSGICVRTRSSTRVGDDPQQLVEIRYGRMSASGAPVPGGRGPRSRRGARARASGSSSRSSAAGAARARSVPGARAGADQWRDAAVRAAHRRRQHFPAGVRRPTPVGGLMNRDRLRGAQRPRATSRADRRRRAGPARARQPHAEPHESRHAHGAGYRHARGDC